MFKFIKAKGPHQTAERQKLQKELYSYRRTLQHGFPHKPSALAWDPSLRLICIGTATGALKVFGKPGVEFYGQHQNPIPVTKVVFLPSQGRVVSLCDDNSLHLWEVNRNSLVEVKSQALEGKLKKISTMCLESAGKHLLLGTEGGNIYLLDLNTFTMTPDIIYQDVVMQNVPQDYKLNPGAVESIFEQPDHPNNILVGYNRGLIVLWNRIDNTAVKTFISNQQLESLCWKDDGLHFLSSHNDGSYMEWNVEQSDKPCGDPVTIYGPYACRAIPKICTKNLNDEPLIAFSGGLPRANYADKYSVSVIHGDKHVAFDFTSKAIDFILIESRTQEDDEEEVDADEQSNEHSENTTVNGDIGRGEPEALLVLAEEELVAIDLRDENWKMMNLPYLVSLHASAITCSQYVSGVPEKLWGQLKDAGRVQTSHLYSSRRWPVDGGKLLCSKGETPKRELLLTGHEDGTVRFWDAGGVTLTPIYKFGTAQFFAGDEPEEVHPDPEDLDEEWPPFRKTGIFDPYSDDPRLAVKRVTLCPLSGTLVVGGTAGQIVVSKFDTEVLDGPLKTTAMNIVCDRDGFVWKGHGQLSPKQGNMHQPRGFQATSVLQLHPPAAITCCVLHSDWGLVAAGTAHGLALLDYVKNKPVMVKCTLNPNDLTGSGDTPISRRKSFKKSLRESFRRLRRGRSTRRNANKDDAKQAVASPPPRKLPASDSETFSPLEAKPVERQIEARATDDSMGSFVRCLYFARTFLVSVHNTNPTLWAGTNGGTVYAFAVTVPAASKRPTDDVSCRLAKEVQLKHRAPVIAVAVLDGSHRPLPEPLEVEQGAAPLPDAAQAHRVVIASEEQFKIFSLPSLKPYGKYKLTAHEGARVRRMAFANFTCTLENTTHSEVDLLCLTNTGDCLVLTIPDLKRQLNAAAIKKEDINGISSLVFTKDAQALYLHSSSELQRFSLAANGITMARCYLPLPEGARDEDDDAADASECAVDDAPSPEEGGGASPARLVNGGGESKEGSVAEKSEERRSNGGGGEPAGLHNVTVSSSVGDITIDSVKDHLGSGEDLNGRAGGAGRVPKAIAAPAVTNGGQEVVAVESVEPADIIESQEDHSAAHLEIREIQVSDILLRAPLALAEEDS